MATAHVLASQMSCLHESIFEAVREETVTNPHYQEIIEREERLVFAAWKASIANGDDRGLAAIRVKSAERLRRIAPYRFQDEVQHARCLRAIRVAKYNLWSQLARKEREITPIFGDIYIASFADLRINLIEKKKNYYLYALNLEEGKVNMRVFVDVSGSFPSLRLETEFKGKVVHCPASLCSTYVWLMVSNNTLPSQLYASPETEFGRVKERAVLCCSATIFFSYAAYLSKTLNSSLASGLTNHGEKKPH